MLNLEFFSALQLNNGCGLAVLEALGTTCGQTGCEVLSNPMLLSILELTFRLGLTGVDIGWLGGKKGIGSASNLLKKEE